MEINAELNDKIQELQLFERNLQAFSMERQNLQIELNEIDNALDELSKTGDEVYKILSGLMIKSEKNVLSKSLNEKKKVLELRISAIEKQEKSVEGRANILRAEINDKISPKSPKSSK